MFFLKDLVSLLCIDKWSEELQTYMHERRYLIQQTAIWDVQKDSLITHRIWSNPKVAKYSPPAEIQTEHSSLILVKTACSILLSSLNTLAFLSFRTCHRVSIAIKCAAFVPLSVCIKNHSSISLCLVQLEGWRLSQLLQPATRNYTLHAKGHSMLAQTN